MWKIGVISSFYSRSSNVSLLSPLLGSEVSDSALLPLHYWCHVTARLLCQTSIFFYLISGYQLPVHISTNKNKVPTRWLYAQNRGPDPVQEKQAVTGGKVPFPSLYSLWSFVRVALWWVCWKMMKISRMFGKICMGILEQKSWANFGIFSPGTEVLKTQFLDKWWSYWISYKIPNLR